MCADSRNAAARPLENFSEIGNVVFLGENFLGGENWAGRRRENMDSPPHPNGVTSISALGLLGGALVVSDEEKIHTGLAWFFCRKAN